MPIVGAHVLLYTPKAEETRAMLRDVLGWDFVEDAASGSGWLIFALPPAELGVHPTEHATSHELCLMCRDLESTMNDLRSRGVAFRGEPRTESFGIVTTMILPGDLQILLYEPTHESPLDI
jgi:catechol 2,3-dioxygenase-like lactoylglutathione lyase family enzyme